MRFETLHPFLDGNGRLGRLLITLLLCSKGALREPPLDLSLYFKTNRDRYYDRSSVYGRTARGRSGWHFSWKELTSRRGVQLRRPSRF